MGSQLIHASTLMVANAAARRHCVAFIDRTGALNASHASTNFYGKYPAPLHELSHPKLSHNSASLETVDRRAKNSSRCRRSLSHGAWLGELLGPRGASNNNVTLEPGGMPWPAACYTITGWRTVQNSWRSVQQGLQHHFQAGDHDSW